MDTFCNKKFNKCYATAPVQSHHELIFMFLLFFAKNIYVFPVNNSKTIIFSIYIAKNLWADETDEFNKV